MKGLIAAYLEIELHAVLIYRANSAHPWSS